MEDRDVMVTITMKASQIEGTRRLFKALAEFPAYAWHNADQIEQLLLKETASPEDGEELAKLAALLKVDCVAADQTVKKLAGIVQSAVIHDPAGRKGPLQ